MNDKFPRSWAGVVLPLLLTVFCWPVLTAAGEGADLEAFLAKVENESAAINSFTCEFRQVRHLAVFPRPVEFSGQLTLDRPDRLRWEFRKPLASVLVLDGNKGLKCGENIAAREFSLDNDPVMRLVAAQLRAWTSGSYRQLRDAFDLALQPGPTLVFSPRETGAGSFISGIKVVFDPRLLQPQEVEISEPGGDRTVLTFSSYQRNIEPPDAIFSECLPRK